MNRQSHWNKVWTNNRESEVSWFQERPDFSIDLVKRHAVDKNSRVLDVGGGSSRLVDALLADGFKHVGVLDVAEPALDLARSRLGDLASPVEWLVADVTTYEPARQWDVWHDRAAFHFLMDADDQKLYVQTLRNALAPGGVAVIATFGPDGPKKCSGLDVMRHSSDTLDEILGPGFELLECQIDMHRTPSGAEQQFVFCVFRRDSHRNGLTTEL